MSLVLGRTVNWSMSSLLTGLEGGMEDSLVARSGECQQVEESHTPDLGAHIRIPIRIFVTLMSQATDSISHRSQLCSLDRGKTRNYSSLLQTCLSNFI